jgi:hypothetical protein
VSQAGSRPQARKGTVGTAGTRLDPPAAWSTTSSSDSGEGFSTLTLESSTTGREPGDAERSDVAALVPSPRTRPAAHTKRVVVFDLTVPYAPVEAPTAGFGEAGR